MNLYRTSGGRHGGFTLVELLLVMVIIAFLASLMLTTLGRAKERAQRITCLNNQRQLTMAWSMYAEDNAQWLVRNGFQDRYMETEERLWVSGGSHRTLMPFLDTSHLLSRDLAAFADYNSNPNLYKCPTDHQTREFMRKEMPQIRSYSMNSFLGPTKKFSAFNTPGYVEFHRMSELNQMPPSQTFVFMDVNPLSICFPAFLVEMPGSSGTSLHEGFFHYPTSQHRDMAVVSFADGHVQMQHWRDRRTATPRVSQGDMSPGGSMASHSELSPYNIDLKWIQQHTTRLK